MGDGDKIRALMTEGLNQYALGDVDRAVDCWRQVLAIESDHAEALDYLRAAGFEPGGEPVSEPMEPELETAPGDPEPTSRDPEPEPVRNPLLDEALKCFRSGDLKGAVDLLEQHTEEAPENLQAQAYLDLARSKLVGAYRKQVGDLSAVPTVRIPPEEIMKYNLPARAGFVLSLVDGATSTGELLTLSGMDPFDTLRVLTHLIDADIVEAQA